MGVLERKEREREQRRLDILESARQVFLKHGLTNTTMDRIASEAELAKGTLYLYFRNRDELLMALVAQEMESLVSELEQVVQSRLRPDRKLLRGVDVFYRFATEHELFYQVMTQVNLQQMVDSVEVYAENNDVVQQFHLQNQRMFVLLKTILEEGIEAGLFYIDRPVERVVLQMILTLKGTVVILRNSMLPPLWPSLDLHEVLVDQAHTFIRALTHNERVR